LGTGLATFGSRTSRNANSPVIAARLRLIVAGEYPSNRRPSRIDTTFGAGLPGSRACRHAARNRNSTSVSTASNAIASPTSQRKAPTGRNRRRAPSAANS